MLESGKPVIPREMMLRRIPRRNISPFVRRAPVTLTARGTEAAVIGARDLDRASALTDLFLIDRGLKSPPPTSTHTRR